MCACAYVCVIDPHHATVTGLRVASTQETMGTDSRWQRQWGLTLAKCYLLIGAIAGGLFSVYIGHVMCCNQNRLVSMVEDGTTSGRWPSICLHAGAHCHFVRHHKQNFHWSGKIHRPDNR